MSTTLIARRPLEPGKPVEISERDANGNLVGAWKGYWNFRRGTVALYPDYRNRFAHWPGGRIPDKRVVSDRMVRSPSPAATTAASPAKPIKSQTAKAMKELIGQEKIKF